MKKFCNEFYYDLQKKYKFSFIFLLATINIVSGVLFASQRGTLNLDDIVSLVEEVPVVEADTGHGFLKKLNIDIDELGLLLLKAEFFYLNTKSLAKNKSKEDLNSRKSLIELLYGYKSKFSDLLLEKRLLSDFNKAKIEYIYLSLLNEVIRRLEIDTELLYGKNVWKSCFFSRLIRPIFVSGVLTVSSIGVVELLKKMNLVSEENCKKAWWGSVAVGSAVVAGKIAYNFK